MNFQKKNIRDLSLFRWFIQLKNKDFSKISARFFKEIILIIVAVLLLALLFICFEVYIPLNPGSHEVITFTVQKGWSDDKIADNLQKLGIIRSGYFFEFYVILSLKHSSLQAGDYNLSSKMSSYEIANKMAQGDVIRDKAVILEGWDIKDIGKYLEQKGICKEDYFISLTKNPSTSSGRVNYSEEFDFLDPSVGGKPKDVGLEGYLFPDTYEISKMESCEDILNAMLINFEKKLTPKLRDEIKKQGKSIFDIVTMASIIEKEVLTMDDRKIVSGIFWKRLEIGMPLQSCATINYITGKNDPGAMLKDIQIDSPYNTYKYYGLPKGPISNPGIDSITAAIYPMATNYLYYLSNGKTIFSETLQQHNAARAKYLDK